MIKGIDHVGICTKDTDMLANWYSKVLGFKVFSVNQAKNPKTYFLSHQDGSMVEIYSADTSSENTNNKVRGLRHIALVTDAFEQDYQNLKENNVEFIGEPNQGPTGNKTVFFRDPEGNILHLMQRADK